jgi:hypothetical protein
MSIKLQHVDLVLGAPTEATIVKLPSSMVNKAFDFFLTEIKNGDDVIVEFDKPKQMVPTFDKSKSDSILILQYSNAEEQIPATIAVILELDLNEGVVKMTGHGFTQATLSVEIEEFPTTGQIESMHAEDVKANEANNVEDAYDASGEDLGK